MMGLMAAGRVLRPGGIFVAEMPEAKRAEEVAGWTLLRDRTYGHTRLAVYKLETERQRPEEDTPLAEAGD
jgi:16S rRNA G966 N2-methylase RsmD